MHRSISRRRFLGSVAGAAAAAGVLRGLSGADPAPRRPRVALLATEVRKYSHAQHFIDRLLEGYGWEGTHRRSPLELVSLYIDQVPEGDLSRERSARHQVPIFPTIAESLTLGGSKLAVDGVLIIAEHGKYPSNDKGQKLYPRHRFFKEIVKVFAESGRAVPVFNDKHLSTDWRECVEMVEDSRRMGFAFLAGSSLPVTWRIPAVEVETGAPLEESLCAAYAGVDSYDIHGLETAQCMSERRAGGEKGVRSVEALRGAGAWARLASREESVRLLLAALARSHSVKPADGYVVPVLELSRLREACPEPIAYFLEHLDGFRTTLLLLNGLVQDFTWAGRVRGMPRPLSCQMHLPMPPREATLADFFNPQVRAIEETIISGKALYPVERTLLTSGVVIAAVDSLHRGGKALDTPHLAVSYGPVAGSSFWRS